MVAVSAVVLGDGQGDHGRIGPVFFKEVKGSAHLTMALSGMTRRRFRQ